MLRLERSYMPTVLGEAGAWHAGLPDTSVWADIQLGPEGEPEIADGEAGLIAHDALRMLIGRADTDFRTHRGASDSAATLHELTIIHDPQVDLPVQSVAKLIAQSREALDAPLRPKHPSMRVYEAFHNVGIRHYSGLVLRRSHPRAPRDPEHAWPGLPLFGDKTPEVIVGYLLAMDMGTLQGGGDHLDSSGRAFLDRVSLVDSPDRE
jgi:hypothetical protein